MSHYFIHLSFWYRYSDIKLSVSFWYQGKNIGGTKGNLESFYPYVKLTFIFIKLILIITSGRVASKTSVTNCLDHMLASTRAKVTELHADYGDKPIILVGIGTGATLACQV